MNRVVVGLPIRMNIQKYDGIAGTAAKFQVRVKEVSFRSVEIFVEISHEGDGTLAESIEFAPEFGHSRIDIIDVLFEFLTRLVADCIGRLVIFDRDSGEARGPFLEHSDNKVAVARTEWSASRRAHAAVLSALRGSRDQAGLGLGYQPFGKSGRRKPATDADSDDSRLCFDAWR